MNPESGNSFNTDTKKSNVENLITTPTREQSPAPKESLLQTAKTKLAEAAGVLTTQVSLLEQKYQEKISPNALAMIRARSETVTASSQDRLSAGKSPHGLNEIARQKAAKLHAARYELAKAWPAAA